MSTIHWSPSTGAFYHSAVHASDALPADAIEIGRARHRELREALAAGRAIVANDAGRPVLAPAARPNVAELRAAAVAAIKREARRRILAIAAPERQANDNAALALLALELAGAGVIPSDLDEASAAGERRRRIDAIRAASNAIEVSIEAMDADVLGTFDAAAAAWPEQQP